MFSFFKKIVHKETDVVVTCEYEGINNFDFDSKFHDKKYYNCKSMSDFDRVYYDLHAKFEYENSRFFVEDLKIQLAGKVSGKEVNQKFISLRDYHYFLQDHGLTRHKIKGLNINPCSRTVPCPSWNTPKPLRRN